MCHNIILCIIFSNIIISKLINIFISNTTAVYDIPTYKSYNNYNIIIVYFAIIFKCLLYQSSKYYSNTYTRNSVINV